MSAVSEAEDLIIARRILNLQEDADRLEVMLAIVKMWAETERAIMASRPSIRDVLRESLEVQADYDEERRDGWALEPKGNPFS